MPPAAMDVGAKPLKTKHPRSTTQSAGSGPRIEAHDHAQLFQACLAEPSLRAGPAPGRLQMQRVRVEPTKN